MTISNGITMKKHILYPPSKPTVGDPLWEEDPYENVEITHPLLTIEQSRWLRAQKEDYFLNLFIFVVDYTQFPKVSRTYNHIFHRDFQEKIDLVGTTSFLISFIK